MSNTEKTREKIRKIGSLLFVANVLVALYGIATALLSLNYLYLWAVIDVVVIMSIIIAVSIISAIKIYKNKRAKTFSIIGAVVSMFGIITFPLGFIAMIFTLAGK